MDTENATPADPPPRPARAWVWWCDDASIAAGQISVLAVAEVFAAVGLYWWLATHFAWPWLSLIGLIAAPMLLLRSPESVERGVDMLRRYWGREVADLTRRGKAAVVLLTTLATGFFTYTLAQHWLPGYYGWALLLRAGVLGAAAIAIAFAIAVMVTGPQAGALTLAAAAAAAAASAAAAAGAGAGAVASAVAGTVAVAPVGAVVAPLFASFCILGILLRALVIRWTATLRHLLQGVAWLPHNWRETLMVVDFMHPPELLPQAGRVAGNFTVAGLSREPTDGIAERIFKAVLIVAWYLPALAYRWSLKASAWLWWPLALALVPPLHGLDDQRARERAAITVHGVWAFFCSWPLPVMVMVWLSGSAFEGWLQLLPGIPEKVHTLTGLLPPPPFGIRYGFLWLASVLALVLWWRRTNLKATHDKVLTSPKEGRDLTPQEQTRFRELAARVERVRIGLIVALLFLVEAFALDFAHAKDPQLVERLVWPWLLRWL